MHGKVICMASAKGGSGKTSLAATFGSFLSKLTKKVLLIDADPATNGLTLLFIKEVKTTADYIMSSASKEPVGFYDGIDQGYCDIVKLSDQLHLIPIDYSLQNQDVTVSDKLPNLQKLLCLLREQYDFIFVDAQAGADKAAHAAINRKISDEVIIVSEYDPMSAAGVERLKGIFREDLSYDRTWVLLNKILPEFAKYVGGFLEFAKYLSPIPWSAEVVRAYARRQLAVDTDTGTEHTLAVVQTLKGLCGDAIQKDIDKWVQSRAAMIRQPIEQQYRDAEKELEQLLQSSRETIWERYMSIMPRMTVIMLGITGVAFAIVASSGGMQEVLYVIGRERVVFAVAVIMGAVSALGAIWSVLSQKRGTEQEVKEARLNRQRALLETKLKRLEVLRTLDAESLLQQQLSARGKWTELD